MFEAIKNFIGAIFSALTPFAYGLSFAFLVCPIYNGLRKKKVHKYICSVICLLVVLAVFALLLLLIVPQLLDSITLLVKEIPVLIEESDKMIEQFLKNYPDLQETVSTYYSGIGDSLAHWFETSVIPNISGYLTTFSTGVLSVVNAFKNVIIGLIIMIYFLNMKDVVKARAKKICYSLLKLEDANIFIEDCRYTYDVFNSFLIGKIIDSAIIGVLTFIVVSIFQIPYAAFISIIVGITNIIPFFGPFIGAIPCALIVLVVSPIKCLEFVVIILVIQQLDGNVIGPKILGQKVGVSSFWILFAILLFGAMFGFVGMIIGIPIFAVIYRVIKRSIYKKLGAKDLSTNTEDYNDLIKIDEETKEYIKEDGTDIT